MPLDVERVRIIATYTGNSSNFIVDIGWDLIVNERLGTAWNRNPLRPHALDRLAAVSSGSRSPVASRGRSRKSAKRV